MKKKVLCFAGLPGTGKSTVSRIVSEKTRGLLLDLDIYKKQVVDPKLVTESIDPPDLRWKYYSLAIDGMKLLPHEIVIVDEVFHLGELRRLFEERCAENHMETKWFEVTCPTNLVKERLLIPRPGHILSPQQAIIMNQLFSDLFEPFSLVNNYTQINNDGSLKPEILAEKIVQTLI